MEYADHEGLLGKEFVIITIDLREAGAGDEGAGSAARTRVTGYVGYGWLALFHSSSVNTPFLINS